MKKKVVLTLLCMLALTIPLPACGKNDEPKDVIVVESSSEETPAPTDISPEQSVVATTKPTNTPTVDKPTPEPEEPAETKVPVVTANPTAAPTLAPTKTPVQTIAPTVKPTKHPEATKAPATEKPAETEAPKATDTPKPVVTDAPVVTEAPKPTDAPTEAPKPTDTPKPTEAPTPEPTQAPAHEHSWDGGTVTTEATCGTDGVKTYACACGQTKTETIPATGNHNWVTDYVFQQPTCSCHGIEVQKCTDCTASKNVDIPRTDDHSYEVTEAGCGIVPTMYECKDCHTWYEEQTGSCSDADGNGYCDNYGHPIE